MATGRVWAGFFYTQTQPAGLDPSLGPDPFIKRIFFSGPRPASRAPFRPTRFRPIRGPNRGPKKKKKEKEELNPKQSPNENLITV